MASQKKKTQKVILSIKVLIWVNMLLALVVIYFYTHRKEPSYNAIYKYQGKSYLIKMTPLLKPIISRQSLLQWAGDAATAAYTYDVAHYQQQFEDLINMYFTEKGGQALMTALQQSGAIDKMVSEKLVVTSVVNGAPLILRQGELLGNFVWRVQVPILVNYQSASEMQTERYVVTMLVQQIPTNIKAEGIGISEFKVARAIN